MKTYHVGGINPIRDAKPLADALAKVNHDDIIELLKTSMKASLSHMMSSLTVMETP